MRDYTLSQIIEHCKKMNTQAAGCESCRGREPDLHNFCQKEFETFPSTWRERYSIDNSDVHPPAIATRSEERYALGGAKIGTMYVARAYCSVCSRFLDEKNGEDEASSIKQVLLSVSAYCPSCGAKLR